MIPPNTGYNTNVSAPGGATTISVTVNGQEVVPVVTSLGNGRYKLEIAANDVKCDGNNNGALIITIDGVAQPTVVIGPCPC